MCLVAAIAAYLQIPLDKNDGDFSQIFLWLTLQNVGESVRRFFWINHKFSSLYLHLYSFSYSILDIQTLELLSM